jgi:hypothetical protein
MPQGSTTVNFGAFPGASDTSATITGQATITTSNLVEAWIYPVATADHSVDEHWVETIDCKAGSIVNGVGFTIWAKNNNQINEPVGEQGASQGIGSTNNSIGGRGTRLYGQWTVGWVWN